MFVREKRIGRYTYVYLVETVREDGRTKQRTGLFNAARLIRLSLICHTCGRKWSG